MTRDGNAAEASVAPDDVMKATPAAWRDLIGGKPIETDDLLDRLWAQ